MENEQDDKKFGISYIIVENNEFSFQLSMDDEEKCDYSIHMKYYFGDNNESMPGTLISHIFESKRIYCPFRVAADYNFAKFNICDGSTIRATKVIDLKNMKEITLEEFERIRNK